MNETHTSVVRNVLESNGWTFDKIVPAASIAIMTRVGVQQASVWIYPNGSLHWEYHSEGRNVLSTHVTAIPSDATDDEVTELVSAALVYVWHDINLSYARRLYIAYPRKDEDPLRCEVLSRVQARMAHGSHLVIHQGSFSWFINRDGRVQMRRGDRNTYVPGRFWPTEVAFLSNELLDTVEDLVFDDPRITKFKAYIPDILAWLNS